MAGVSPDRVIDHQRAGDPALRAVPGRCRVSDRGDDRVLAASTLPLLLVIAQELMAGRAGLASGLIMGLGFTMSAIGIPITGAVADAWGIQNAMRFQALDRRRHDRLRPHAPLRGEDPRVDAQNGRVTQTKPLMHPRLRCVDCRRCSGRTVEIGRSKTAMRSTWISYRHSDARLPSRD